MTVEGRLGVPKQQERGQGHFSGPERVESVSLGRVGFASWQGVPVSALPGQVALETRASRASEQAQGRGLSRGSCRLEPGREAPLVTAPHETLMPGRRTAISRHLEPKRQPRRPVAVGGQLSPSCPPGWSPDRTDSPDPGPIAGPQQQAQTGGLGKAGAWVGQLVSATKAS